MASAPRAANARTILATTAVTGLLHITHIDRDSCTVVVDDPSKLNGTFEDLGVQEIQMPAFREILASLCPEAEVHGLVLDEEEFPLTASTPIAIVVGALEAALADSEDFKGACLPKAAPTAPAPTPAR